MQTSAQACPAVQELPGRSDAEIALAAAFEGGRLSFYRVVVYLPDHITQLIEEDRCELADRALLAFCQSLVRVLPAGARLYRWTATSLVVLTDSVESAETLAASGIAGTGRRRTFDPASAGSLANLTRKLDFYVAQSL